MAPANTSLPARTSGPPSAEPAADAHRPPGPRAVPCQPLSTDPGRARRRLQLIGFRDEGKVRFLGIWERSAPARPDRHGRLRASKSRTLPWSESTKRPSAPLPELAAAPSSAAGWPEGCLSALRLPRAVPADDTARKERFEKTDIDDLLSDMTPMEFMLRFTISHPDMHTTIVGTQNPAHLAANVAAASKGASHLTSIRRPRNASARRFGRRIAYI